jgi:hypothetical protein
MPTDPWVQVIAYAFEGVLGLLAVLLTVTYVTLMRMNKDVRRARMFIMADRIHRVLGAFTLGFVTLAVYIGVGIAGAVIPAAVSSFAIFFFLGAIAYGIIEIYLIVRPRPHLFGGWRRASGSPAQRRAMPVSASDGSDGGHDAPR